MENTKNTKNHFEQITIANGGIVGRCWEKKCRELTLLRFVTEVRNLAPMSDRSWKDTHTFKLCDSCADREKQVFARAGGKVIDGRPDRQSVAA